MAAVLAAGAGVGTTAEKQKAPAANEMSTKAKVGVLENELSNMVGLHDLKLHLHRFAKGMLLDEWRRSIGLEIGSQKVPHMAFLGNPGTGKTMVARVVGKLLHLVNILPTDKVTEVQRTDLVGEYIGHTGPKTRAKIKQAEGGVLFVDEAYRLTPADSTIDFGIEALEEIMSFMDSGKIAVVFAGYAKPMEKLLSSNEGLRRRVTNTFTFDDFSCEDLAEILRLKMSSKDRNSHFYGFKLHPSCSVEAVAKAIKQETSAKQRKEMNGGLVDQILAKARENLDSRIDVGCKDKDRLVTIMFEDIVGGLRFMNPKKKQKMSNKKRKVSEDNKVILLD